MFLRLCAACLLACCSCSSVRLDVPTLDRLDAPIPDYVSGKVYPNSITLMPNIGSGWATIPRDEWATTYVFDIDDSLGQRFRQFYWVSGADLEYDGDGNVHCSAVHFRVSTPSAADDWSILNDINATALPLVFLSSYSPGVTITSWHWSGFVFEHPEDIEIEEENYRQDVHGMECYNVCTTHDEGPYFYRLSTDVLDYLDEYFAQMIYMVRRSADWDTAYREGWRIGYDSGYLEGGMDASVANVGNIGVIPYLFGGIANVPINILNGLADFTVWNIPVLSVIFTFLFLALVLWVVKRFV